VNGDIRAFADEYAALCREGIPDKRNRLHAAEEALKEWFKAHPDATAYATKSGLIKVSLGSRKQLDNAEVRKLLGDELAKFQVKIATRSLSFEPFAGEHA